MRRIARLSALLTAFIVLAAACGGGGGGTTTPGGITVEMKEWTVTLSKTALAAGSTTFNVKNTGSTAHDLIILKTDAAPDALPQVDAKAKEDGRVAGIEALNPSASRDLTVDLKAGKYLFICNQPGHYALGMRTQVIVQ